eukprot:10581370-Alexandrium_andersonii.AAC.1
MRAYAYAWEPLRLKSGAKQRKQQAGPSGRMRQIAHRQPMNAKHAGAHRCVMGLPARPWLPANPPDHCQA